MASHYPPTTVTECNHPVRVLCRQRLVQPASDLKPRHSLSLSGGNRCVRASHLAALVLRSSKTEAPNVIADNDVRGSSHSAQQFDYSSSVADATHAPVNCAQRQKIVLTVTKRNSGQFMLRGFYRLLPQLVGSCDPGGEVGGWGPPGLTYWINDNGEKLSAVSPHKVALKASTRRHRAQAGGLAVSIYASAVALWFTAIALFFTGASIRAWLRSPRSQDIRSSTKRARHPEGRHMRHAA